MSEINLTKSVPSVDLKISKKEYGKCLIIILFMSLLFTCTGSYLFHRIDASFVENRSMQNFPSFTLIKYINNDFQGEFDNALSDQFFLRETSITLYNSLKYKINKTAFIVLN